LETTLNSITKENFNTKNTCTYSRATDFTGVFNPKYDVENKQYGTYQEMRRQIKSDIDNGVLLTDTKDYTYTQIDTYLTCLTTPVKPTTKPTTPATAATAATVATPARKGSMWSSLMGRR